MSYQKERDQFISTMTREGLPLHIIETLLREAAGFQRRAELACSSEAADRDRVPCPKSKVNGRKRAPTVDGVAPCLCDSSEDHNTGMAGGRMPTIPRITLQDWHAEQRVKKLFAANSPHVGTVLTAWAIHVGGDPRGYVLRVIPPSYAERNDGRDATNLDSIGVPTR